jgi:transcriptional regulator with XRE-family HTH domain
MPTKGRTLRVQRTREGVKQIELAARMGVHRNTVKRYEDLGEVPPDVVRQYLAALATFDEPTAETAVSA